MTLFLTIFWRFPKIFQNCSEGQKNVSKHFPNNSEHFPKITEDCWRWPKKIWRCFDHTPTNSSVHSWRDKREMLSNMISSHARISYRFYQFVTTRYTTDFYIIKAFILKKGKLKHCELFLYPKYPAEKNAMITIMNHNYDFPIFF